MSEVIWAKILDHEVSVGRVGAIPVFDGSRWIVFRNSLTIYPGAENVADPAKVDLLRVYVNSFLEHYPDTVRRLSRFGAKVRPLLTKRIETPEDVEAWANSIFNVGPLSREPLHVQDTMALAYDDFVIEVKDGKNPVYVIPAGPRGSGVNSTIDFSVLGSKIHYGPRHEYSKTAFEPQTPEKPRRFRGQTIDGERRGRGRPRHDGLRPGSEEAKAADEQKKKERQARHALRLAERENSQNGKATITELPTQKKKKIHLARVGQKKTAQTS
jgi:hypothetical protein